MCISHSPWRHVFFCLPASAAALSHTKTSSLQCFSSFFFKFLFSFYFFFYHHNHHCFSGWRTRSFFMSNCDQRSPTTQLAPLSGLRYTTPLPPLPTTRPPVSINVGSLILIHLFISRPHS